MLEDVEVSKSLMKRMKRMKSTGEMTEPRGTPALIECRLERKPSTLTFNCPIREETTNPINESVMETKHRQFSEKTLVPNAIKGLGDNERDHSALTTGF